MSGFCQTQSIRLFIRRFFLRHLNYLVSPTAARTNSISLRIFLFDIRLVFVWQVLEQSDVGGADERECRHEKTPVPEHFGGPHGRVSGRPRADTNDRCCG